jgi:hypothetical protein
MLITSLILAATGWLQPSIAQSSNSTASNSTSSGDSSSLLEFGPINFAGYNNWVYRDNVTAAQVVISEWADLPSGMGQVPG